MSADPQDPLHSEGFDSDVTVERRRSHREPIVAIGHLISTVVSARSMQMPIQILVTEVSLHGCDFRCESAPEAGTFYRLELAVGPLALTSRLRVIRIRTRYDGMFEVGAEFV